MGTLIGAGHLLFADRSVTPPQAAAVCQVVTTVIAGVLGTTTMTGVAREPSP